MPPASTPGLQQKMARNVPTELLRSFIAIVEAGSMAQATEKIFLTQSALSLQMKRLEEVLQQKLFRRDGRKLLLSPIGEELVVHARELLALNDKIMQSLGQEPDQAPIILGIAQDFADELLPEVLAHFRAIHPRARITVRVGSSTELLEMFDRARLDILLGLGQHGDRPGARWKIIGHEDMVWLGDIYSLNHEDIPLVLLDASCRFRDTALRLLSQEHQKYRIVMETSNLPAFKAGIRSGLGIGCRTRRFAIAQELPELTDTSLPKLPSIEITLMWREGLPDTHRDLIKLLQNTYAHDRINFEELSRKNHSVSHFSRREVDTVISR